MLHKKLKFNSSKKLSKKQKQFYRDLHYYFRDKTEEDLSNLYYIEGFTGDELDKKIKESLVQRLTTMQAKLFKWATKGHDNEVDVLTLIRDYRNLLLLVKYTDSDVEQEISI